MKTGWYNLVKNIDVYMVVKPLPNNSQQSLYIGAESMGGGRYNILFGIFPTDIDTITKLFLERAWEVPTSTNQQPSAITLSLALQGLKEIETEIKAKSQGKRRIIYVDGLDKRRLRIYTKVLNRYNFGYKTSSVNSDHVSDTKMLYKVL